jgi:hypothetical protein
MRGGRNVEFHYYNRPFFSLHRKWLFSWSLLRHHYIKNGFLVDHYIKIDKDHHYKNQNVEKNVKRTSKVSFLSDFHILTTYGVSTYGILAKKNFKLSNLTQPNLI